MRSRFLLPLFASATGLFCLASLGPAQQPFTETAQEVNKKMVKLFGAGGFKGMPSYGTGIMVSPDGFILTVNNHILNTADLRVHIHDGRLYNAKVIKREPDLDLAMLEIEADVDKLPDAKNDQASAALVGFDLNFHTLAKATLTGLYGRPAPAK